jgi:hypothetical protein
MVHRKHLRSTYTCDFCGNQSTNADSCNGCGGSSFRHEIVEVPGIKTDASLHTSITEVKKRQKHFTICLSIAIAALAIFVKVKEPNTDLSAPGKADFAASDSIKAVDPIATENIPETGFRAYYYRKGRGNLMHHETVSDISLQHSGNDKIHGIAPRDLMALWVGKLNVEERGFIDIFTNEDASNLRVRIDGTTYPLASTGNRTTIELEKGKHIVEVEHKSTSRSANFNLAIRKHSLDYSKSGIVNQLSELASDKYRVLYVYQSRTPHSANSTLLHLADIRGPVVLVLDSYKAIDWKILNPQSIDLRAIVTGAYKGRSSVHGENLPETLSLIYDKNNVKPDTELFNCNCSIGCRGSGLVGLTVELDSIGTGILTGITMADSAHSLAVPEITISSEEISQSSIDQMRQQEACPRPGSANSTQRQNPSPLVNTRTAHTETIE